jgi:hypothetical protein
MEGHPLISSKEYQGTRFTYPLSKSPQGKYAGHMTLTGRKLFQHRIVREWQGD